jgi:hypothetical protein
MRIRISATTVTAALIGVLLGAIAAVGVIFSQVKCYDVFGVRRPVLKGEPMYGLPLLEQWNVLSMLYNNKTNAAIARLNVYLDFTLYDAMLRRRVLTREDRMLMDQALSIVAKFREVNARPFEAPLESAPAAVRRDWDASQKLALQVDDFLQYIRSNAATKETIPK